MYTHLFFNYSMFKQVSDKTVISSKKDNENTSFNCDLHLSIRRCQVAGALRKSNGILKLHELDVTLR